MASVTAVVTFDDGQTIQIRATGATSYPDCLSQLRAEAVEGVRGVMAIVREVEDESP